jgi:hypothetical protein
MFYDTKADILDGSFTKVGEAFFDIQPFEKSVVFEDRIEIDISQRAFCDASSIITQRGYLRVNGTLYKIMNIKDWDDYYELWLYRLERSLS